MVKQEQSYQELKSQLDEILVKLQQESVDIDQAIELHARGQAILKELDAYLSATAKKADIEINRVG